MSIRQSIFALFAAALLAASCATATPRSFERVVDKAETNGASYSEQDWAAADAQYEEFMEKYSDMETLRSLTPEKRGTPGGALSQGAHAGTDAGHAGCAGGGLRPHQGLPG